MVHRVFHRWGGVNYTIALVCCVMVGLMYSGCAGPTIEEPNFEYEGDIPDVTLNVSFGLAPFENQTRFQDQGFEAQLMQDTTETVQDERPSLILRQADGPLPKLDNGRIDNFKTAEIGRQQGLNAFVAVRIIDIRCVEKDLGFWWFEETVPFLSVHVALDIVDTETGARLYTDILTRETEIDGDACGQLKSGHMPVDLLQMKTTLAVLGEMAGEAICDVSEDQAFKTYVQTAQQDQVVIPTGTASGLVDGVILAAYDTHRTIEGKAGERFFIPGPLTGLIRITSASSFSSQGQVVAGNIMDGQVCLKRYDK